MMTHRQRFETAWSFREPDRVPIEAMISPHSQKHPAAARLLELIDTVADNLIDVGGLNFGFIGLPVKRSEKTLIEDRPGEFQRYQLLRETAVGTFTAITYHPAGEIDYHWEKRFVTTLDDFKRVAEAPRPALTLDVAKWQEGMAKAGDRGLPIVGVWHPLGNLIRNSTTEEVYTWFHMERETMHRYLAAANSQVAELLERALAAGVGPYFGVSGHEVMLPPWMGHALFDEFVFPYDKRVNDVIHRHGGKLRAHCHGNCMDYLEQMVDMGLDAIEPLEHLPTGDVDLAEAKRRVGDRMMLCGNIASERFLFVTPEEVRSQVRDAIRTAAPGGGFALRTSGGHCGTCMQLPDEIMAKVLANVEAFILAGLEFGQYPIRG
ncbi:MAG: hypothetical protein KJ964_03155 [Verrucomicrobia bacterium]|nr:hypothetical protein [Verrucomicrobiota bacterium]MBU1733893.1 hypothetical protein [Verrucomicrobiota bacterium]MBU1855418.1 hypothetical protein [Verrucomicrobiota bacterium]